MNGCRHQFSRFVSFEEKKARPKTEQADALASTCSKRFNCSYRPPRLEALALWYGQLLPDLNLVRVAQFTAIGVKDAHILVRITIELLADL